MRCPCLLSLGRKKRVEWNTKTVEIGWKQSDRPSERQTLVAPSDSPMHPPSRRNEFSMRLLSLHRKQSVVRRRPCPLLHRAGLARSPYRDLRRTPIPSPSPAAATVDPRIQEGRPQPVTGDPRTPLYVRGRKLCIFRQENVRLNDRSFRRYSSSSLGGIPELEECKSCDMLICMHRDKMASLVLVFI